MAILFKKKGQRVYISASGAVTDSDKDRADKINQTLKRSIKHLESEWIKKRMLTKGGVKKDTLRIWYELGEVLRKISEKYGIVGTTDEPFFWQVIYEYVSPRVQKNPPPKRSSEWKRNHFRLCSLMASRSWDEVKSVGTWSVWRDIFDNSKLLEDDRVFEWVVDTIKRSGVGHKELRPFIHSTRKRLKKIDTSILSDSELLSKLQEVKVNIS